MLDYLIENAKYPDFENNVFKTANIGIKDSKIAYIGNQNPTAKSTIKLDGEILSPGFIDIHMHEENFLGEGNKYIISKMMLNQGVTTAVGGNCGVMHQSVSHFKEVIKALGGAPINYLLLSGYNEYRTKFGLNHFDPIDSSTFSKISKSIKNDLDEGAIGISFGFEYDPGISFEEILDACNISNNPKHLIAAHYRTSCTKNIDAVLEMIEIQNNINKPFQISHLSSGCAYGLMDKCLDEINKAIEKNPLLNYDTYPYNAFSTVLGSTVFNDGCLERWKKDYDSILLTEDPYMNITCTEEIFRDARKNYPEMLAVVFAMNESEIAKAISNKYGMIASDGIINNGKGHPRAAGTFPRVISKYALEDNIISLIDALRKITIEPSKRLRLDSKKGQIKEGYDADITIFNPNTIKDNANFIDGSLPPSGISYVFVNGKLSLINQEIIHHNGFFIPFDDI